MYIVSLAKLAFGRGGTKCIMYMRSEFFANSPARIASISNTKYLTCVQYVGSGRAGDSFRSLGLQCQTLWYILVIVLGQSWTLWGSKDGNYPFVLPRPQRKSRIVKLGAAGTPHSVSSVAYHPRRRDTVVLTRYRWITRGDCELAVYRPYRPYRLNRFHTEAMCGVPLGRPVPVAEQREEFFRCLSRCFFVYLGGIRCVLHVLTILDGVIAPTRTGQ